MISMYFLLSKIPQHKNLLPFTHTAKTNKKAADKEALKELRDMLKELEFASGPRGQMT